MNQISLLSDDEIAEVLTAPHPEDFFIGGLPDPSDRVLVLYRGSLEPLSVPFAWFERHKRNVQPDFADFEVTDGGQTIRLGPYEAAADAILYDFDADARARMKANLVEKN